MDVDSKHNEKTNLLSVFRSLIVESSGFTFAIKTYGRLYGDMPASLTAGPISRAEVASITGW
jgi:hypothetical protein